MVSSEVKVEGEDTTEGSGEEVFEQGRSDNFGTLKKGPRLLPIASHRCTPGRLSTSRDFMAQGDIVIQLDGIPRLFANSSANRGRYPPGVRIKEPALLGMGSVTL